MNVQDLGVVVSLDTGVDISTATTHTIEVLKPSGATASWLGTLDPDNRSVNHTIVAGDLDETGIYLLSAKVTIGSGVFHGDSVALEVKGAFE
jgi:hypothetical protein